MLKMRPILHSGGAYKRLLTDVATIMLGNNPPHRCIVDHFFRPNIIEIGADRLGWSSVTYGLLIHSMSRVIHCPTS